MFVKSNKASDLKQYFYKKLGGKFSSNELKMMFQLALQKRLNLSPSELLFLEEIRMSESDLLYVRTIAHRLLENEPFQYLIGETEFYGLNLKCDARALIPRPETEELVELVKQSIPQQADLHFLDCCSGSGCIALALKSVYPSATISGIDISEEALALSKENSVLTKLNVDFSKVDLLMEEPDTFQDESLDCIVSNPPYIPNKEKNLMSANVLDFEPHLALFVADDEALIFYKKIGELSQKKLKSGGLLFFELNENYAEETKELLSNLNFKNVTTQDDLQGKKRMLRAEK